MNKNKNCNDYEDEFALLHYGELGADEAERFEAHLASCPGCSAEYDLLRRTLLLVPSFTPARHDVLKTADRVMEGIAPRKKSLGRRLVPALIGAGALALAVLFTIYFNASAPPAGPPNGQRLMAQSDVDVLENLDLMDDMDTIEDMDIVEGIQEEI